MLENNNQDGAFHPDVSLIISRDDIDLPTEAVIIGYDNYDMPMGVFITKYNEKDIEKTIKSLRNNHGDEFIIGVHTHNSYDNAMIIGEAGADFVAFDYDGSEESLELIETWDRYTVVPFTVMGDVDSLLKQGFESIMITSEDMDKIPE
ncbi:MAG: hypothetical protein J0G32_04505 [Alphaproteobacteria bacterium]|nr:hypothetical protein [Alphaproteobacteria bacterium]OJV17140.1 MAG: hypothetical protein BGO27_06135 [Alphaproteobacteria bacterium 33-17]